MRVDPKTIILTLNKNHGRIRLTARQLNISPGTVLNWRNRARSPVGYGIRLSSRGLTRKSTQPRGVSGQGWSIEQKAEIVRLRQLYGYSALKLKAITRYTVSKSTIHRYLVLRRLTAKTKNYRRPRYQPTTHMYVKNATKPGYLQMDVKYVTPELSGLKHTCYLYAVMDIYSRYKLGLVYPSLDQAVAIEAIRTMTPRFPFQAIFIQTDNGLEFQTRFHAFVSKQLRLQHHYIHKSSPNENAVIERSFRTDEEEFFWRMSQPASSIDELNLLYQKYLLEYNTFRPHLGIDLQTPLAKIQSN